MIMHVKDRTVVALQREDVTMAKVIVTGIRSVETVIYVEIITVLRVEKIAFGIQLMTAVSVPGAELVMNAGPNLQNQSRISIY